MTRRHRAFTLIEVAACLVIAALLASVVAVSLRGQVSRGRLSDAAEKLQAVDSRAREESRRHHRAVLLSPRPQEHTITVQADDGAARSGFHEARLTRIATLAGEPMTIETIEAAAPPQTIPIRPDGTSPSYAIELRRGEQRRYLLVAGGSGQTVMLDSEDQAREILGALSTRLHAD